MEILPCNTCIQKRKEIMLAKLENTRRALSRLASTPDITSEEESMVCFEVVILNEVMNYIQREAF